MKEGGQFTLPDPVLFSLPLCPRFLLVQCMQCCFCACPSPSFPSTVSVSAAACPSTSYLCSHVLSRVGHRVHRPPTIWVLFIPCDECEDVSVEKDTRQRGSFTSTTEAEHLFFFFSSLASAFLSSFFSRPLSCFLLPCSPTHAMLSRVCVCVLCHAHVLRRDFFMSGRSIFCGAVTADRARARRRHIIAEKSFSGLLESVSGSRNGSRNAPENKKNTENYDEKLLKTAPEHANRGSTASS